MESGPSRATTPLGTHLLKSPGDRSLTACCRALRPCLGQVNLGCWLKGLHGKNHHMRAEDMQGR